MLKNVLSATAGYWAGGVSVILLNFGVSGMTLLDAVNISIWPYYAVRYLIGV